MMQPSYNADHAGPSNKDSDDFRLLQSSIGQLVGNATVERLGPLVMFLISTLVVSPQMPLHSGESAEELYRVVDPEILELLTTVQLSLSLKDRAVKSATLLRGLQGCIRNVNGMLGMPPLPRIILEKGPGDECELAFERVDGETLVLRSVVRETDDRSRSQHALRPDDVYHNADEQPLQPPRHPLAQISIEAPSTTRSGVVIPSTAKIAPRETAVQHKRTHLSDETAVHEGDGDREDGGLARKKRKPNSATNVQAASQEPIIGRASNAKESAVDHSKLPRTVSTPQTAAKPPSRSTTADSRAASAAAPSPDTTQKPITNRLKNVTWEDDSARGPSKLPHAVSNAERPTVQPSGSTAVRSPADTGANHYHIGPIPWTPSPTLQTDEFFRYTFGRLLRLLKLVPPLYTSGANEEQELLRFLKWVDTIMKDNRSPPGELRAAYAQFREDENATGEISTAIPSSTPADTGADDYPMSWKPSLTLREDKMFALTFGRMLDRVPWSYTSKREERQRFLMWVDVVITGLCPWYFPWDLKASYALFREEERSNDE